MKFLKLLAAEGQEKSSPKPVKPGIRAQSARQISSGAPRGPHLVGADSDDDGVSPKVLKDGDPRNLESCLHSRGGDWHWVGKGATNVKIHWLDSMRRGQEARGGGT